MLPSQAPPWFYQAPFGLVSAELAKMLHAIMGFESGDMLANQWLVASYV
jgi:hypothetical protein